MANISNPFETDEVVGVIAADRSDALMTAASSAGFDTEIVTKPSAIDVDGDGSNDSMFDKVVRFFQEGEENDALRGFHERLTAGDHLIRIASVGDRAKEAGTLMASHDAELVWHFGQWTYTPLHAT